MGRPCECANRFQAAQYANGSVKTPGVWNGIDVGTGSDGRKIRIFADPTRECIPDRVLANSEASFTAQVLHELSPAQIGFGEYHASDNWRRFGGNRAQRVKFPRQSLLINVRFHCGPRFQSL
jgi:hypothetical protein